MDVFGREICAQGVFGGGARGQFDPLKLALPPEMGYDQFNSLNTKLAPLNFRKL